LLLGVSVRELYRRV